MKVMRLFLIHAIMFSCVHAQYGPDPPLVPEDFKCAWRQLAYDRSTALRPDVEPFVFDSLELQKYCHNVTFKKSKPTISGKRTFKAPLTAPKSFHPNTIIAYVDGFDGNDDNSGLSPDKAKKTIQAGIDISNKEVLMIKGGTYYIDTPITLTANTASNLIITSYGDTPVWLSGGVPVSKKLPWKRVKGRLWSLDVSLLNLKDVASVRKDGERINPARYPNADPEREFWPIGYTTSNENFVNKNNGDWLLPKILPIPNPAIPVNVTGRPWDQYFTNYTGGINGTCSIYEPPFSYWCSSPPFSKGCGGCFTWNIPSGLKTRSYLKNRTGWPYKRTMNLNSMQIFAWRKAHWANWKFEVETLDENTGTLTFGKGGFQGARGGPGSDWFVQNIYEELDQPNEFFYDTKLKILYMHSNETNSNQPPSWENTLVLIPSSHHTLLTTTTTGTRSSSSAVTGSNSNNNSESTIIKNLTLSAIHFRDTASTMLQPHGVPSGGDWALERMASVYMESTENVMIENCTFFRIGGNALMLSKYNKHATIKSNHFAWLGGSAIALWGFTDEITANGIHGIDGTNGDYPRWTTIELNFFREIGVWEKQSSAVFQAKSAETILKNNVVLNLGRAGFNFNDGFGGGDVITGNILFHTCRESSDHGPINSWDRQPYITNVRTGKPDAQPKWRQVRGNLVVANYGGSKEVDNDDGSLFWNITSNVMIDGWGQKFKCGGIQSYDNLKLLIDLGGKFDAGCLLSEEEQKDRFYPNLWHNDSIIALQPNGSFAYRACWGRGAHGEDFDAMQVHDNRIWVRSKDVTVEISGGTCPGKYNSYTLENFQKLGEEPGSKVIVGWPTINDMMLDAKSILDYGAM
jgi:hypothetical protein